MMRRTVFPSIFFIFGSLLIDILFRPEASFLDHFVFFLYVLIFWSLLLSAQLFLYKGISLCNKYIAVFFNFSLTTLFFLFFLLDPNVFVSQGVHLYDRVVIDTLKNPNWNHELQLGVAPFVMVGLALLSFHLLNYFFNRFAVKKLRVYFIPSSFLSYGQVFSLSRQ